MGLKPHLDSHILEHPPCHNFNLDSGTHPLTEKIPKYEYTVLCTMHPLYALLYTRRNTANKPALF